MGRRSQRYDDAEPEWDRAGRRLPPVHLNPDAEPDQNPAEGGPTRPGPKEAGTDQPWRRWLGLGLALVVGATAGVLGANARNDAAQQANVQLVGGQVTLDTDQEVEATTAPATWIAEFTVFNAGERDVELHAIEIGSWASSGTTPATAYRADANRAETADTADDAGTGDDAGTAEDAGTGATPDDTDDAAPTSVVVEPGSWRTVRTELTPDCSAEPPGSRPVDSFTVDARVRAGSTDTTTPVRFGQGYEWVSQAWNWSCTDGEPGYPEVMVETVDVVPREASSTTVRTDLSVAAWSTALVPADVSDASIIRVWADAPGFEVTGANLPVALDPTGVASVVQVEWDLVSCEEARRMDHVRLQFHVTAESESRAARVRQVDVPQRVLFELGRLSAKVCGLQVLRKVD